MCGLTGYCDFNGASSEQILKKMTEILSHRGPDDQGLYYREDNGYQLGLGHRRLSIIELSELGHQPMSSNGVHLVFNGEIYNHSEIRREMLLDGISFNSHSDTEVLLKGYIQYGTGILTKMIGMFSFALYDDRHQKLYLVRDRAGVKPMFYYWKNDFLAFGSELKSLMQHPSFRKDIDYNSLSLFLHYSYIPTPHSIFKDTFKLNPGSYLELDLESKSMKTVKYWDVLDHYNQPKLELSDQEAIDQTEQLMTSSYQYRMVSDVPVGVFLSGGYDSTSVAALLQKNSSQTIKTFTIGFAEKEFDEAPVAREIANYLGTDHYELYATPEDAARILPDLPNIYDEPFADNSVIPTTLVSQFAREKVKVALSADGGDELFAGYDKFERSKKFVEFIPSWAQSVLSSSMGLISPHSIPLLSGLYNFPTRYEKMKLIWGNRSASYAMKIISQYIIESEMNKWMIRDHVPYKTYFDLDEEIENHNDVINRLLAIDFKTFLVDNNLTKVDRATMSVGLEGREPMLDHRLVEFVSRLPSSFKIRNGVNKYILKEIVHKHVPRSIMERPKKPFIAPLDLWFKNELKDMTIDLLDEEFLQKQGIFDADEILKVRDFYLDGGNTSSRKVWNLIVFQNWYKHWMK